MADHIKPTIEELDAGANKALEEAEALEKQTHEEVQEETEEVVEEQTESQPQKLESEEPDYKKKFTESTREAQVLHAKTEKMEQAISKATEMPDPTEEELKSEYPEWEEMSNLEKRFAKDSFANSRRIKALNEISLEFKDIESWNKKVSEFVESPETLNNYPELEGREDEFRLFASKKTRRGVDFEDLINAFRFGLSQGKVKNKGKMFETGGGGEKPKINDGTISLAEARTLRQTNYSKYVEYLKAGKIKSDI